MLKAIETVFAQIYADRAKHLAAFQKLLMAIMAIGLLMALPQEAFAQSFADSVPFINQIGCGVVKWMKGPLAVVIFIVVVVAVMVVGMIAKMDWGRIITVAVIFGIVQGIISLLMSTGTIAIPAACMGS